MAGRIHIDVFKGKLAPQRWYWRLVWANGQTGAHSEAYKAKATALEMARKLGKLAGIPVKLEA
jgi:hypothetical protein